MAGVRLRPGTAFERDEPIAVFWKDRPLHTAMHLLAEEFRWDAERGYGWFWLRVTRGGETEYELHRDVVTRQLPEKQRQEQRERFAADLEKQLAAFKGRPAGGIDLFEAIAYLPPALWRKAVAGQPQALYAKDFPEPLRATAPRIFGGWKGGPQSYVSVAAKGEGPTAVLEVYFCDGAGGIKVNIPPSWARSSIPREFLHRMAVGKRTYTGLAARPVKLEAEQSKRWKEMRDLPDLLAVLTQVAGVDLIADDYAYTTHWGPGRGERGGRREPGRAPAGEPLGFWLDLLCQTAAIPGNPFGRIGALQWREEEGCLLLRNANWWSDDFTRVPAATRRWLRQLQAAGDPRVLTLAEARRVITSLSDAQLKSLAQQGYLPDDGRLYLLRSYLELIAVLDPPRLNRLFSPSGLAISELSPAQRAVACTAGPQLHPVAVEKALREQMGGDARIFLRIEEGQLRGLRRCPARADDTFRVDLRLPTETPEVCRVARVQ